MVLTAASEPTASGGRRNRGTRTRGPLARRRERGTSGVTGHLTRAHGSSWTPLSRPAAHRRAQGRPTKTEEDEQTDPDDPGHLESLGPGWGL